MKMKMSKEQLESLKEFVYASIERIVTGSDPSLVRFLEAGDDIEEKFLEQYEPERG